jgi:twitching motility protein PilJ
MSAQEQDLSNAPTYLSPDALSVGESPSQLPFAATRIPVSVEYSSSERDTEQPEEQPFESSSEGHSSDRPSGQASRKGLKFGAKATILATLFGVVPVIAVGWIAYRAADQAITEQIAQEKIAEASQLSGQLSRFLQERLSNVKTVASVVDAVTSDSELSALTSNAESSDEVVQSLADELTTFAQDYRTYANLTLYDVRGRVLVQSRGSAAELNQSAFPYFQQVLKTKQPAVSEPIETQSVDGSKRLSLYVAAPVENEAGQTIAIVAGRIPVEFLGNAVLRTTTAQEGETHRLIDSAGRIFQIVPSSDGSELGTAVSEVIPIFPKVSAQRQQQAWLTEQQLHAYAPVKGMDNLNWSVVVSTDATVAFVGQQRLLEAIALGTTLTALLAALVGALIAELLTRPILQVTKTVEKLGQGNLDTRVSVQGNDELAVLSSNVNQMATRIQTLLATLRQNAVRVQRNNAILAELSRHESLAQGDLLQASKVFVETTAKTLEIERVSVWLYSADQSQLICLDLYQRAGQQHISGVSLRVADFPNYFAALTQEGLINAPDVQTDPRTSEMAESYLIPLNIVSMLDFPIQVAGRMVGVVCCEHVGTRREWKPEEEIFVYSIASLVALALESDTLQTEVGHLLDIVSSVEEGDLTVQAQVSDRTTGLVADTFNRLLERLSQVLTQVLDAARQVSEGVNQQRELAVTVATNAQQQADAVTQVLSLTEQVEHAAQDSAEQVNTASESLRTVATAVNQGQSAIASLTQGIQILQEGSDRITQRMKTLGEFVGLADQFVQEQGQIAFITQTLALNASLVAARASEQHDPSQFIVVAREFDSIANQVNKLAQQTNEGLVSLEQRSAQIHSVVSAIDADVQSLGELVRGFMQGVEQSNQVFGNVQTITDEAVRAGESVGQMNQSIVSAAQSTAQVMRDIAQLAAKTADLTQISREQSDRIDWLSAQLLQNVQFFRLSDIETDLTVQERVDLSAIAEKTVTVPSENVPTENNQPENGQLEDTHPIDSTELQFPWSPQEALN